MVDVGVGRSVEKWLSQEGYDVKTSRGIDPRLSDDKILNIAVSEKRMVITMDKDYGELVFKQGQPHTGVLLLRLDDARASEKVSAVSEILKEYSKKIAEKFCVYKDGRLRVRP